MPMSYYLLVLLAAFVVDIVPFIGPPAWTVMVLLQMMFGLNIWAVLILGVIGSTIGRYVYSLYIPLLSGKLISAKKNKDIAYIGQKLGHGGIKVQLFVLLYTLMPLPSTPLFTAAGMARIKPLHILPAFFIGKFTSDMVMVLTGDYAARNAVSIAQGLLSWKTISGTVLGIIIVIIFLFIDWRSLLMHKKFRMDFRIWNKGDHAEKKNPK